MTQAQRKAANPDYSVWVSANAGTGKTKVLTDRVLRLLLAGSHFSQILCLTFTKAAAVEMKSRLMRRLSDWQQMEANRLREALTELLERAPTTEEMVCASGLFAALIAQLESLKIQTIHAFCQSVLNRFPLESGIPLEPIMLEDQERELLFRQALHQVIRNISADKQADTAQSEAIRVLLFYYREQELVSRLMAFTKEYAKLQAASQMPTQQEIEQRYRQWFQLPKSIIFSEALLEAKVTLIWNEKRRNLLSHLMHCWQHGSDAEQKRAERASDWLQTIKENTPSDWESYCQLFLTKEGKIRAMSGVLTQKHLKAHPELEQVVVNEQNFLEEQMDLAKRGHNFALSMALWMVANQVQQRYQQLKEKKSALDYDDLIARTVALLSHSEYSHWVLYKMDARITHLLVDEAQDTSAEQWELIKLLSQEFFAGEGAQSHSLFVVGDEKQSIYSFQGAAPELFQHMARHFEAKTKQAGKAWQTISLSQSFRSTKAILSLVDQIFQDPALAKSITAEAGGIMHEVHRHHHYGRVECWPLFESAPKPEIAAWQVPTERLEYQDAASQCANHIADEIASWLAQNRLLPSKGRAIQPSDIMILFRKRSVLMDRLIAALKQRHIPVSGKDRLVLNDHIAVKDMLALWRFLSLPKDDFSLACVLKSPLCGLDEEDLFTLCTAQGEQSLWQHLCQVADREALTGTASARVQQAVALLRHYQRLMQTLSPYQLISQIIDGEEKRNDFAKRLGDEVHEVLTLLCEQIYRYQKQWGADYQAVIAAWEASESEIKREQEIDQNNIRIMTVHGSKGLQAPIVILPDTMDGAAKSEPFCSDAAAQLVLVVPAAPYRSQQLAEKREQAKQRIRDEYYRLLYVALTRAEDMLYVTGIKPRNNAKDIQPWYHYIATAMQALATTQESERYVFETAADREQPEAPASSSPVNEKASAASGLWQFYQQRQTPSIMLQQYDQPQDQEEILAEEEECVDMLDPYQQQLTRARGTGYHLLLEYLPGIKHEQRHDFGLTLLQESLGYLPQQERERMVTEITQLLVHPECAFLFDQGKPLWQEQRVLLQERGQLRHRTVDYIIELDEELWIIDFKSGQLMEDQVPAGYRKQLADYKRALTPYFPKHPIRTALLYIEEPRLLEIEGS